MINQFKKLPISQRTRVTNKPEDTEIAKKILELLDNSNNLKALVENNRRVKKNASTDVFKINFPFLLKNR